MTTYYVDSASGVTFFLVNTAYALGDRMVPAKTDAGTNYALARGWVWECTTAGTSDATLQPTWPASVTQDTTTITSGTAVFTARMPGYSSGTTQDWTFASPLLLYATQAAKVDGDRILVDWNSQDILWANTTYTFTASVSCITVNKTTGLRAASSGGLIGHTTIGFNLIFNCTSGKKVYMWGFEFQVDGSAVNYLQFAGNDGSHFELEACFLYQYSTNTGAYIALGGWNSNGMQSFVRLRNCYLWCYSTSQYTMINGRVEMLGGIVMQNSPNGQFRFAGNDSSPDLLCEGVQVGFGASANTLVASSASAPVMAKFVNSTFPTGSVPLAALNPANLSNCTVFLYNCNNGANEHWQFGHFDALGSTVAITSIYANDGALYDGVNHVAWQITTTAAACESAPYHSPWIDRYYYDAANTSLQPYVEILRDGSATAYTDAEVWGEFTLQSTAASGGPQSFFYNDANVWPDAAPADQEAGIGVSGWTGQSATAWSGRVKVPSPQLQNHPGYIRARICVAAPSVTAYVDPTVRF